MITDTKYELGQSFVNRSGSVRIEIQSILSIVHINKEQTIRYNVAVYENNMLRDAFIVSEEETEHLIMKLKSSV